MLWETTSAVKLNPNYKAASIILQSQMRPEGLLFFPEVLLLWSSVCKETSIELWSHYFKTFHRITQWLRLERTSGGNLAQLCSSTDIQGHVQAALEDPQGDPTVSGNPVSALHNPHSTEELLVVRGNLLCPWPLVLALSTIEQSLVSVSWHPPFRQLWILRRPPWASSSPVPVLSAFSHRRSGPLPWSSWWAFVGLFPDLCCVGKPRIGHSTPDLASSLLRWG